MISISWPLLLAQVGTFLLALLIVWKLFWGPLTQLVQERSRKISDDISRAEAGRREIEALEAEYHRRLGDLEQETRKRLQEALQQGSEAKEEIVKAARHESQRILEKARQDLIAERALVLNELCGQVTDLSLKMVERLAGHGQDQALQRKLLDRFLEEIRGVEKVS